MMKVYPTINELFINLEINIEDYYIQLYSSLENNSIKIFNLNKYLKITDEERRIKEDLQNLSFTQTPQFDDWLCEKNKNNHSYFPSEVAEYLASEENIFRLFYTFCKMGFTRLTHIMTCEYIFLYSRIDNLFKFLKNVEDPDHENTVLMHAGSNIFSEDQLIILQLNNNIPITEFSYSPTISINQDSEEFNMTKLFLFQLYMVDENCSILKLL